MRPEGHIAMMAVAVAGAILAGAIRPSTGSAGVASSSATLLPQTAAERQDATPRDDASPGDGAAIDGSEASAGAIWARASAADPERQKLLVTHDGIRYAYDLPGDGTLVCVPANMGNGTYAVSVMRRVRELEYAPLLSSELRVTLDDEDAPFLRPNVMCDYAAEGICAREASRAMRWCPTEEGLVMRLFLRVTEIMSYDREKADRWKGESGYLPDPDATLAEGRGICIDYASALAAMLRSCGVPAKVAVGTVLPTGEHHAWVEVHKPSCLPVWARTSSEADWVILDPTLADALRGEARYLKAQEY